MSSKEIKLTLRGNEIVGSVTDDDAIFFLGYYFNDEEKNLVEQGLEEEALSHFRDRLMSLADRGSTDAEQKFSQNICLSLRRQISHDWETRKNVCWRILECFPTMPESLVYWHSDRRFGIRLSVEELIGVFVTIISTAMNEDEDATSEPSTEARVVREVPPRTVAPSELGSGSASSSLVDEKKQKIQELQAQLAALQ